MSKRVFTFHYTLKNDTGQILDSSQGNQPFNYLEGSQQLIPGLVSVIESMAAGDSKTVNLGPNDAYGQRDERLRVKVPRDQVPKKDVQVGDHFQITLHQEQQVVIVDEVTDSYVSLDGNHPLAGKNLQFELQMVSVREATDEEKAHGHAHAPGDHSH